MRRPLIAAAVAVAALTGCGEGSPAPAGHQAHAATDSQAATVATPNPCDLVTAAEVGTAVKATVTAAGPEDHNGLPGQRTCGYSEKDTAHVLSVAVWPADAALYERMKAQAGAAAPMSDLGDLGEKAFGDPRYVAVLKGQWMINVVIVGFDVTGTAPAVAVARAATSRI
ncbi:DUF3558 domain-containing protein [Dactylosporangium sp. AC04546]|uniref:DUF3558 domain-containing protein n=1 Tax=Dactylosporangium sp. AC04546 TaxID=2862460 RepID=UPI001EDF1EF3|nr:DUF3558 domain-containing protein [Dactylosporangium sp. AC04546]WVK83095.1 DUF3558 domain-containing protein [Dactylosporangium sp. AC04546]